MDEKREPVQGDTAVVVADLPESEGDEHGVPLQTVVTVESKAEIKGRVAYRCSFYNNGEYANYFYLEELAVVD